MSTGPCLGCGEALCPEGVVVEGLDVCRTCLAPRAAPRKLCETYPPVWWGAAMGGALIGALLLGGALGHAVEVGLRLRTPGAAGAVTGLAAALGGVAFALKLRSMTGLLDRRWKRKTAARLGLAHLPLERFSFAVFLLARQCPWPEDAGLLAETGDALVFLGRRGGTSVLPLSSIRGAAMDGFCGAWWVRLGLRDGSCRWVLIREGGETAWGRAAATAAFADRLRARLSRHGG